MEQYKACTQCKQIKTFNEFPKNKQNKTNGLHSQCKNCRNSNYKKYASNNLEKIKNKRKKYRQDNRLLILAKHKKDYLINKEVYRKKNSEWGKNNRLKTRERTRRRRFRLQEVPVFFISNKEFKKLYTSNCFYCKSQNEITIDHIIPISRGGTHGIGNLVSCCKSCNSSKNNKTIMEWKMVNKKIAEILDTLY